MDRIHKREGDTLVTASANASYPPAGSEGAGGCPPPPHDLRAEAGDDRATTRVPWTGCVTRIRLHDDDPPPDTVDAGAGLGHRARHHDAHVRGDLGRGGRTVA